MSAADSNVFNPTDRTLRQFAAIWIVFLAALAVRQEFQNHRHVVAIVLAVLAGTVGSLVVVLPRVIKCVFVGWMTLAYPIGWTTSRIALAIVFYGLFTPVAWVLRLIGRDALRLKAQPNAASYWRARPAVLEQSQYLRQF